MSKTSYLRAHLALRVVREMDLDLDAEDTLAHENVADGLNHEDLLRLARRDEVTIRELHHLRALGADLRKWGQMDLQKSPFKNLQKIYI